MCAKSIYSDICIPFPRCGLELQELEAANHRSAASSSVTGMQQQEWEIVIEQKDFKVWKRPMPNSHLYEYRGKLIHNLNCLESVKKHLLMCFGPLLVVQSLIYVSIAVLGSYTDVTPRQFFNVQVKKVTGHTYI